MLVLLATLSLLFVNSLGYADHQAPLSLNLFLGAIYLVIGVV